MKKNPIEISKYIRDEFSEFVASTYTIDDEDYQKEIERELKSLELFKGPYLNTVLPFNSSYTIRDLINMGILSSEFLKLDNIHLDRKLYKHQVDAIKKGNAGRNLVVTTGTGSGKTESFLFPILNYILRSIEDGTKGTGVKAIFLYPMNALVNDQIERVREILSNYPDITYGSFTGDTKETDKDALKVLQQEGTVVPSNELISREQMRETPPDLLFTNYSMLEYLLIRPKDRSIISKEKMSDWQFLVLDEAHTYKGTLGIELSMLIKRLCGAVEKQPQFILTSATLGDKSSVKKIINFAENLTAGHYDDSDVVFADRKSLVKANGVLDIDSKVYKLLKENLKDTNELRKIVSSYVSVDSNDSVESCLYKLLIKDKNVYRLFEVINGTNTYENVIRDMKNIINIDDEELVSLIQLISLANDEGNTIYDSKFHMFVSSPNKAFITIGPKKLLRIGNHKEIDGLKAFELGVCRNCGHPYIIGNIKNGVLEPDDTVDVYENYEDAKASKLDFFMLDPGDDSQTDEGSNVEEFTICAKCGTLYNSQNLKACHCNCGNQYLTKIYRINNDNSQLGNNITKCAHCNQTNTFGMIKSFHLNKDSATAILSQIFYHAIGDSTNLNNNTNIQVNEADDDLFGEIKPIDVEKGEVKQLLAFSDSRQQASFASVFFGYNHEKNLKRRLVWEEIKNTNGEKVKTVASELTYKIKNNNLFDFEESKPQSIAWTALLTDILYVDGQYSSEGIALYSYDYNIEDPLVKINKMADKIQALFGLTIDQFITLIKVTIDRFRKNSAVEYHDAELSDSEKRDAFQFVDQELSFVLVKAPGTNIPDSQYIRSFIPTNPKMNNVTTSYIKRVLKCDDAKARDLATKLFNLMVNSGILVPKDATKTSYLLSLDKFIVKPYTSSVWYRCDKCKKVTLHNINGVCPEKDCTGHLEICDPDVVFKNNYYRKEYMTKDIEKIVVKEHTAQLSKLKAKQYQKDFKNKKINILSCSTTFEMGVDIGSLENVFLRNMPPSPANYVQRAGRAGRSKDSAALVVTYCGNTSHDFAYFNNPDKMVNGVVNPPQFDISNKKIVIRHILASAFGFYFKLYPMKFDSLQNLVFDDNMKSFIDYIKSKPSDLNDYLNKYLLNVKGLDSLKNYKWLDDVLLPDSKLMVFIDDLVNKKQNYKDACDKAIIDGNLKLGSYFQAMSNKLEAEKVISSLSEHSVIPKYGFPVDIVNLDVYNANIKDKSYNMQRDLSVAISEYAPDSEVIADGNKYVSRYINLPKERELERYYYHECPNCKNTMISPVPFESGDVCKYCGEPIQSKNYFIIPSLGFSTERVSKKSRTMRPKKTYSGSVKYIGGGKKDQTEINYKNLINISVFKNDQLAVVNEHNFYCCPECGYTKILDKEFAPKHFEKTTHQTSFGYNCQCKELERVSLGHIFVTDVIKIQIGLTMSYPEVVSLVFALIEGMCYVLQIDRNDINGIVVMNNNKYELVLYDNVPGGAGHVKRLADVKTLEAVLNESYNIVNNCRCDQETTCYSCLRNYSNQKYHSIMKRKYAKKLLDDIINY